jgi:TrmH family RNA methyltransferase
MQGHGELLTSPQNPLLKEVKRAAGRGTLTEDGFAIAEGPHLLEEAQQSRCEIKLVLAAESASVQVPPHIRLIRVPSRLLDDIATTENSQGIIALVRPPGDPVTNPDLIVVLDAIQDPGNAGAIVRAGEAFGVSEAVFLKGSVSPWNPKCIRASAGSLFRIPVTSRSPDLPLVAAVAHGGQPLSQTDLSHPFALVIGSEAGGVRPELADRAIAVTIPTTGVESLNAAVAAGILLYEAQRQRKLKIP